MLTISEHKHLLNLVDFNILTSITFLNTDTYSDVENINSENINLSIKFEQTVNA